MSISSPNPSHAWHGPESLPSPIYVEISPLLTRHLTGIGRFVARLVEGLSHVTSLRLVNTIQGVHARNMGLSKILRCGSEIVVPRGSLTSADGDVQAWTKKLLRGPQCPHDFDLAKRSAAIFTMLRPGERHFRRELIILYDFTSMLLPWAHVDETRIHFGRLFSESAQLCDNLIAISESTKQDASWMCEVTNDRVVVGYPGPSLCVADHCAQGPVVRRKDLLLMVSTLEPRKNGVFLLDWFRKTKVLSEQFELCWVGPDGWNLSGVREAAQDNQDRKVRFPGMVSDEELCRLYRQATLSIYPSLYEGFGFPVLDSLRHGTPVLCGYNSSLKEFAGPGVFFFDACDPQSLDEACRALLAGPRKLPARQELDQVYSWDELAHKTVSLCA